MRGRHHTHKHTHRKKKKQWWDRSTLVFVSKSLYKLKGQKVGKVWAKVMDRLD
jgi:hypothetical protein